MTDENGITQPKKRKLNEEEEASVYDSSSNWSTEDEDDEVILKTENSTSEWSSACELSDFALLEKNRFIGNAGTKPIHYFNFFFEEKFLTFICYETNAQAAICNVANWSVVTVAEFKIFLGLLFHMGTIQIRRIRDYWTMDRLFSLHIFGQQMTRNRFQQILNYLKFSSETDGEDAFRKVRTAVDYFNDKMNECYYPGKELTLDDCAVLWRGRIKFNNLNKPNNGIKLYTLTEPDGLVLKLCIYAGNPDKEQVVLDLLDRYLNNGHSVYMDTCFNSIYLFKTLLDKKTYCTGLLNKELGDNPTEIVEKELKKGENISRFSCGIHIGKWKDKRCITYISSEFANKIVSVRTRRDETVDTPIAIAEYDRFMTGADRLDQLTSYYPCEKKTMRSWSIKLGIHIFQLLLLNSYKIYNKYTKLRKLSFNDYRLSVINDILPLTQKKEGDVNTPIVECVNIYAHHKIAKVPKQGKGRIKRKVCRNCALNKKRTDTIYMCNQCPGQPGLCFECYDDYHEHYAAMDAQTQSLQ